MAMGLLQQVTARTTTLVVSESLLITSAVVTGAYVQLGASGVLHELAEGILLPRALLIAYACQLCLYFLDLYEDPRLSADLRELPALILGRGVFAISALLVGSVVVGWRLAFAWCARRVGPRERLLLVGTNPAAVALARELHERREDLGVQIVGFIDPDPARVGEPVINPGVIGTIEDIPAIVRARRVDEVVVSLSEARG